MDGRGGRLHVLFDAFPHAIASDEIILNFLPIEAGQKLGSATGKVYFAREEMSHVRSEARRIYNDLISRIAATPLGGRTLRQALARRDRANPWWYQKVSARDVEWDTTFNTVLTIMTIERIAAHHGVSSICLVGGSAELSAVFGAKYRVEHIRSVKTTWKQNPFAGLLVRLRELVRELKELALVKKRTTLPDASPDVVFEGFWDWSVEYDAAGGAFKDHYFKRLPAQFEKGGRRIAWFVWFQPQAKPYLNRSWNDIISQAPADRRLIFVQHFLGVLDVLKAYGDFRPLFTYLLYSRKEEYRALFREKGLDFFPLLQRNIVRHFADGFVPNFSLVEEGCRRAFARYRPRAAITFLELFLFSRAFYAGRNQGSPETILFTMQHASYAPEKLMYYFDPARDFTGAPDGQQCPAPEYVFAMGELGARLFREAGFPAEKVYVTGSARYGQIGNLPPRAAGEGVLRLLLVTTLNTAYELEMVKAAYFATEGMDNVEIFLRSHPFRRIEDMPEFAAYRHRVIPLSGTLKENVAIADLLLFTYTTVAEEALISGMPVVQWVPGGFNGSALASIAQVRQCTSVDGLRQVLREYQDHPGRFVVDAGFKKYVERECFYSADAGAADRICAIITAKALTGNGFGINGEQC